jgi:predicted DNA-binding protein
MVMSKKKVRVTLDLSPEFHQRLEALEEIVGGETKANVIRHALQVYEYVVKRSLSGDRFKAIGKDGEEEAVVFVGLTS